MRMKERESMKPLKKSIVIDLKDGDYLLINPYRGLGDVVDKETLKELSSQDVEISNGTMQALARRGHLVEDGEEDDLIQALRRRANKMHTESKKIKGHGIVITYDCNLRCPYCYERHLFAKEQKRRATMSRKTVDMLFETIQVIDSEDNDGGASENREENPMTLIGGEPLQKENFSIVEYILKKGAELGYPFSIVTNGADLSHFAPLLSQYDIKKIQITIDGVKEVHDKRRYRKGNRGSFDDIVKGIDEAHKNGLPVVIRINADSDNIDRVPEFAEFYMDKGWYPDIPAHVSNVTASECLMYSPLITAEQFTKKTIDLFLKDERMKVFRHSLLTHNDLLRHLVRDEEFSLKFWYCGAQVSMLMYDPLGDIYPCFEAVGHDSQKIGEYIPELKFNETMNQWQSRTVFTIPECLECNLAFICGGGCAYGAIRTMGSLNKPYCDRMKFIIEHEFPYVYHLMKTEEGGFKKAESQGGIQKPSHP
ncbi:MAG: radical SAM protein [Theionarchaea archaeon]|nr:radical SAM protein [Theionarchaea archaeon]MBU7000422.1 radical SAM protein [Theionarchaea archaeon]MBU7021264.1 radical SAM protein [Theionarchaea archaeon]MBU7035293.1 radical SAM protein [Theionarchaea archaeon]MBU7039756.1 radical SAM protein [Theionarchaea archaeon]